MPRRSNAWLGDDGIGLAAKQSEYGKVVASFGSIQAIQELNAADAMSMQFMLGHGGQRGFWMTPPGWRVSQKSMAEVNVRERIRRYLSASYVELLLQESGESEVGETGGEHGQSPDVKGNGRATEALDAAVLSVKRYLLLCRTGPAGIGSKLARSDSLSPPTVAKLAYETLPPLAAIALDRRLKAGDFQASTSSSGTGSDALFACVRITDLEQLSQNQRKLIDLEHRRMAVFADLRLWHDVLKLEPPKTSTTSVAGEVRQLPPENAVDQYQRLPNEYVSEMGSKSYWIIKNLGPSLIELMGKMESIFATAFDKTGTPSEFKRLRVSMVNECLAKFVWRLADGTPFDSPPFALALTKHGNTSERRALRGDAHDSELDDSSDPEVDVDISNDLLDSDDDDEVEVGAKTQWPPRTFGQFMGLVATLQKSHLFVTLLSEGARHGEVVAMKRSCLVRLGGGRTYASGLTFKLVDRIDGETRDWVLPNLAVEAIEQQIRLVEACERFGNLRKGVDWDKGDHLWASVGSNQLLKQGDRLLRLQSALLTYADTLGMDRKPGGRNIHPHRFRKTLAYICALAVTHSPKILKDVFGHKSFEMTLYYILADRALAVEIETVARELRVMRSAQVINDIIAAEDDQDRALGALPQGGYGGPAALTVASAVKAEQIKVFRRGEDWGASNGLELAQILTVQGTHWNYVRPGVICTKIPGAAPVCNKGKGVPDSANCQSHCGHRLEEAFLRSDVDGTISALVKDLVAIGPQSDLLTKSYLAEQLRQQVQRFPDLKLKWSGHPVVVSALAESSM